MTASSEESVWRLYFDEDADGHLAAALRRDGIDVVTTPQAGNLEAADDQQLEFATTRQRVLVTHNIAHFPRIHTAWLRTGREHWGIVILVGMPPVGVLLRRMRRMLHERKPTELWNQLVYLGAEYDD